MSHRSGLAVIVAAIILCGLAGFRTREVFSDEYQVAGVFVTAPDNKVVTADEAINVVGAIRVTGNVPANPPPVNGAVNVGYFIREAVYNPFTEQTEMQERFVTVRHLNVSGTPTEGAHSGRGENVPFDLWCNAPPPWRDDVIYLCIGDPRDDGDSIGHFAVGLAPSEMVPWWLAWIFL